MEQVEWRGTKFYFCPSTGYYARRDGRTMHRIVWETLHGPIPKGHHVHHLDGTRTNNDPANLVLLTIREHRRLHMSPKAAEWHRSEEGRAWHREHGRSAWVGREPKYTRRCRACDEPFMAFFPRACFCSKTCKMQDFRARRPTYFRDWSSNHRREINPPPPKSIENPSAST